MNNIIENINLLSNVISIVASTNNYRKIQRERLQKLYQASLTTRSGIQDKLDSFYFYSKRLCPRIGGALRRLGFLALDLRWNENNDQGFFCRGPGALNI